MEQPETLLLHRVSIVSPMLLHCLSIVSLLCFYCLCVVSLLFLYCCSIAFSFNRRTIEPQQRRRRAAVDIAPPRLLHCFSIASLLFLNCFFVFCIAIFLLLCCFSINTETMKKQQRRNRVTVDIASLLMLYCFSIVSLLLLHCMFRYVSVLFLYCCPIVSLAIEKQ